MTRNFTRQGRKWSAFLEQMTRNANRSTLTNTATPHTLETEYKSTVLLCTSILRYSTRRKRRGVFGFSFFILLCTTHVTVSTHIHSYFSLSAPSDLTYGAELLEFSSSLLAQERSICFLNALYGSIELL